MRWSLSELRKAWQYYKSYTIRDFFLGLPKRWKRRIELIFFWLFHGYTQEMLWNLSDYFAEVIAMKLTHFLQYKGMSYPTEFETYEDWMIVISKIIILFENVVDDKLVLDAYEKYNLYDEHNDMSYEEVRSIIHTAWEHQKENNEEALKLFHKYFFDFWD